jgi:hypothetical protein
MTHLRDGARPVAFAASGGRENHPGWYHHPLADPADPRRGRHGELRGDGGGRRGGGA